MNFDNFYYFFKYVSAFSVIVPIGISLMRYKYFDKVSKLMFVYLILSLLGETTFLAFKLLHFKSTEVFNVFGLIEFTLVAYMFYIFLKPKSKLKIIFITLTLAGYVLFFVGRMLSVQILFSSYYNLFLFGLTLLFISQEDRELNIPNLLQNYFYWYNVGFLVYFGVEFFLRVFDDFISSAKNNLGLYLFTIHLITNMFLYAAISIGIWKTKSI